MTTSASRSATIIGIIVVFAISAILMQVQVQQQQHRKSSADPIFVSAISSVSATSSFSEWNSPNLNGNAVSSNLTTRAMIVQYVVLNPGAYLRELSEDLQLPMGVVQYHVNFLLKNGQIDDFRNGRYRRFFAAGTYGELEKKVISVMRQDTPRKIITLLMDSKNSVLSHSKLAEKVGISSQDLTWHMSRLKALGIVSSSFLHGNGGLTYRIEDDAVLQFRQRLIG